MSSDTENYKDVRNENIPQFYKGNLSYFVKDIPEFIHNHETQYECHIVILRESEIKQLHELNNNFEYDEFKKLLKVELSKPKYKWDKFTIIGTLKSEDHDSSIAHVFYPTANIFRKRLNLNSTDFYLIFDVNETDKTNKIDKIDEIDEIDKIDKIDKIDEIDKIDKIEYVYEKYNPNFLSDLREVSIDLNDNNRLHLLEVLELFDDVYEKFRIIVQQLYCLEKYDLCIEEIDKWNLLNLSATPKQVMDNNSMKILIYLKMEQPYNAYHIYRTVCTEKSLMRDICHSVTSISSINNTIINIWNEEIELPQNFNWVIPLKLGGISAITQYDHVRALKHMNVGLVISTNHDFDIDDEWFDDEIKHAWYDESCDLRDIISEIENIPENKACIVQHELSGLVLACYIGKNGISNEIHDQPQMSSIDAINYLREMRPGSIDKSHECVVNDFMHSCVTL